MAEADPQIDVIRRRGARRMKLTVDPRDGSVKLVLPPRAALGPALEWARGHQDWIARQRAKLPDAQPVTPGMIIPFGGEDHVLDWAETHRRGPVKLDGQIRIGGPRDLLEGRLLRWLKREALGVLEAETRAIAMKAGVEVGRIGVGDPRSRWGSCAANGDIRYSWRLILAPAHVRRATVAHEVAHRVHMNHSPAFHALVAQLHDGDPKQARHWLRAYGTTLQRFGR